jgi:hypothetical protein
MTVQLADRRRLDREAVRRDFTRGKKLIERLSARNQLAGEWLRRQPSAQELLLLA